MLSHFLREFRFAVRLLKRPAFAVPVILTFAVGIGVNAGVFSVVHAVLLSPLPYKSPEQLVTIWELSGVGGGARKEPRSATS
ncbi:MAG TPA: hypothetical protein VOA87_03115, partial [Thermoanaerobaculia bacterium]|nr:hypothetical protein [Thermoanaerobaculia bacterium]